MTSSPAPPAPDLPDAPHRLSLLVSHAPRRRVLRCSCGSLHVVWEGLNLSLEPQEFTDLSLLTRAPRGGTLGRWCVRHSGGVGLWHGPLGASFSRADWEAFAHLLRSVQPAPEQHVPDTERAAALN